MEKWEHKSLEWIHKVREECYKTTKGISSKDLLEKTRKATERTAKSLGLKIAQSRERIGMRST